MSYTVFVHAMDDHGATVGQNDSIPLDNQYPTNEWQPNQLIPDTHTITLPEARVRTPLHFQVGLYNLKTGARLPITNRGLPGGSDYVEFTSP
ncbi:MAG TPA: hypothetical protein VNG11_07440 [Chloroflexota bacterium]|nr:hypothetical protein [Chloroflexota bacterium]